MPKAAPTIDLSEFQALALPRGCGVGRAIDGLADQDAANVHAALAATGISHTQIEAWFAKRDIKVGVGPIGRHRRRVCSCYA